MIINKVRLHTFEPNRPHSGGWAHEDDVFSVSFPEGFRLIVRSLEQAGKDERWCAEVARFLK